MPNNKFWICSLVVSNLKLFVRLGPKSAEIIKSIIGCSLIYPCLTRWNSLFDSISQLLIDKAKLNIVFQHLNTNYVLKI